MRGKRLPLAQAAKLYGTGAAIPGSVFLLSASGDEDGGSGAELWRSDGSAPGTVLVADIRPGPLGSAPRELTEAGGVLYFVADDGVSGPELWRAAGGEPGARIVADIEPGAVGSAPVGLTRVRGEVFFAACDGVAGCEPWRSAGEAASTLRLGEVEPGPGSSAPHGFARVGTTLFFAATSLFKGEELWRSTLDDDVLVLLGSAQGGQVVLGVEGVSIAVPTSAGQTSLQVVQALEAAIDADPTLAAWGVTARVQAGQLKVAGEIDTVDIQDPGLSEG